MDLERHRSLRRVVEGGYFYGLSVPGGYDYAGLHGIAACVIQPLRFPNTYLLVGCCNDEITYQYKGKTVLIESERYESLHHCMWVDEVIPDAPWVINQEFIYKHKIDYMAHDALP